MILKSSHIDGFSKEFFYISEVNYFLLGHPVPCRSNDLPCLTKQLPQQKFHIFHLHFLIEDIRNKNKK